MPSGLHLKDIKPHLTTSTALLPVWALASLAQLRDNFNVLPENKPRGREGKGRKEKAVFFQLVAFKGCKPSEDCKSNMLTLPNKQTNKTPNIFISGTHWDFFSIDLYG